MKRAIVAASLLALGSGAALAQDNPSGFYVGAGIGQFNFENDLDGFDDVEDAIGDFDFDDDDNAWKVFAGWRFNRFFSAELAYVDFGDPGSAIEGGGSSGNYTLELSGVAPYLVGTLPLGPVELSARLGYLFYDIEARVDLDDPLDNLDGELDSSEEDLTYGVGIGATFFERLNAKVEYEEIDTSGVDEAYAYWLTGSWRF